MHSPDLDHVPPVDDEADAAKGQGALTWATMPFDPYLALALVTLLGLGLVLVYSSSAVYAARNLADAHRFLRAQAVWTALGLGALFLGALIPGPLLARRALLLLAVTLALLAAVLVPGVGHFVGGARRWLVLGPISCQPSEAAKLTCTIVLAQIFSRRGDEPLTARALWVPVCICQLPVALILLEPDLGTAIVIELILGLMLFAAGLRLRVLLMLALAAMPMLYHLIVGTPFRLRRMLGYIDPWAFRSTATR
jgi:cell division protein FtsW